SWSRPFCTAKDVQGNYAFLGDGLVLVPGTPITGPFMRVGWFHADGAGNVNASTLAVYNGLNFGPETFTLPYAVTPDCAVQFAGFVLAPIHANIAFNGFVLADGDDIFFLLTGTSGPNAPPPVTTVAGHGRKRKLNSCSVKDLQGDYRVEANGVQGIPL